MQLLLGVAFVHARGVNLIARQLPRHGRRRLVATTAFGTTTIEGIAEARRTGFDVRVLNPASSTFHPKVYLARHGDEVRAVLRGESIDRSEPDTTSKPGGKRSSVPSSGKPKGEGSGGGGPEPEPQPS